MTLPVMAISANTPKVTIHDGKAVTTSMAVAEYFHKRHDDVMKKIRSVITDCEPDYHARNFAEMFQEVEVANGAIRKSPMFELTRDAFVLIVMGFTGKKALQWKIDYINAFNRMEAELSLTEFSREKRSASVDASALLSKLDSANAMLKMVCDDVSKFDPDMADRIQSSVTFLTFYAMTLRSQKVTHRRGQLPAGRHH